MKKKEYEVHFDPELEKKAFIRGLSRGGDSGKALLMLSTDPDFYSEQAASIWGDGDKVRLITANTVQDLVEQLSLIVPTQSFIESKGKMLISTTDEVWTEAMQSDEYAELRHWLINFSIRTSGRYKIED